MKKPVNAHIHRFGDSVALAFIGADGETVYLDADQAEQLAGAIAECVESIRTVKYSASNFGSRSFTPSATDAK
ncbi:hypothetical protein NAV33_07430 [Pseudomonas stutzeri]|uniref:hypothetical protein n=1 Tax=Stutzerimonas stutzeri TaxID=316 RepID=UPI00210EAB8B|nr:hypothetical protein [Stutzerimonas stutzeri]MCQ4311726.1 hypothetical protein [Stutzerimonas stutzeri]